MEYRPTIEPTPVNESGASQRFSPTYVREVTAVYRGPRRCCATLRRPDQAAAFVRKVLPDNSREHFVALYLNGAHQVISYAVVATGSANSCPVHPREVFQGAILTGATAIILSHNHPSGETTPSQEDVRLTSRLREAASILGVKILDHVIVTDGAYYSLADGENV